jgi:hypothetical protein
LCGAAVQSVGKSAGPHSNAVAVAASSVDAAALVEASPVEELAADVAAEDPEVAVEGDDPPPHPTTKSIPTMHVANGR